MIRAVRASCGTGEPVGIIRTPRSAIAEPVSPIIIMPIARTTNVLFMAILSYTMDTDYERFISHGSSSRTIKALCCKKIFSARRNYRRMEDK
jgi:hypothetical protein